VQSSKLPAKVQKLLMRPTRPMQKNSACMVVGKLLIYGILQRYENKWGEICLPTGKFRLSNG
jgi:hypothetical protein